MTFHSDKMTVRQLAILADDIASMAQEFIITKDVNSLKNMTTNLANMIRIHKGLEFTINELKALYRILEHQYINYEDQEASTVVSKIGNILREHELANGPSKSTPGV